MTVLDEPQIEGAAPPSEVNDELVPEAPGTPVHFYAPRNANLHLLRQPQTYADGPTGQRYEVLQRVRYDFDPDGTLLVYVGHDILLDGKYDAETGKRAP